MYLSRTGGGRKKILKNVSADVIQMLNSLRETYNREKSFLRLSRFLCDENNSLLNLLLPSHNSICDIMN